jgi:hypothetical protein
MELAFSCRRNPTEPPPLPWDGFPTLDLVWLVLHPCLRLFPSVGFYQLLDHLTFPNKVAAGDFHHSSVGIGSKTSFLVQKTSKSLLAVLDFSRQSGIGILADREGST